MTEAENPASRVPALFTPLKLRGMALSNRVVLSPMCMYSAEDGTVGDFQLVHLGARALGGAGLIITEMTNIHPHGRISPGCAGMYKASHALAWKRVVDFVHGESEAKIAVQLAHAGRKGAVPRSWERGAGGLGDAAWELIAPSAIAFGEGSATPREMSHDDIADMRAEIGLSAGQTARTAANTSSGKRMRPARSLPYWSSRALASGDMKDDRR